MARYSERGAKHACLHFRDGFPDAGLARRSIGATVGWFRRCAGSRARHARKALCTSTACSRGRVCLRQRKPQRILNPVCSLTAHPTRTARDEQNHQQPPRPRAQQRHGVAAGAERGPNPDPGAIPRDSRRREPIHQHRDRRRTPESKAALRHGRGVHRVGRQSGRREEAAGL